VKIAVLGASGFIGGHILRRLRAAGDDVRAVVRHQHSLPDDPDRRFADACDVYALRDALADCDYLVDAVLGSNDVIVGSLAPIYAAAEAVGIRRIVYISTGSVHGQSPAPGTDERSPLSVRHAFSYNNAKVRAERKLRSLRSRGTVEVVILRPTIVFGPGSRWVYDFADALRNGTAFVVDGAHGICNSIYVDNLAHAVRLALTAKGVDGETFLVGDAETVRWSDLYRPIAEAFGADFDAVPSVSPPVPKATFKQLYVNPLRTSPMAQTILTRMPPRLKDSIKSPLRIARRLLRRGAAPAAPIPASAAVPQTSVTPEIAALHRCAWRLPNDKAARMLGYSAPISFAEGCRRSIEWLKSRADDMA
jgi:nucleoside-diphosphate-sugar epimerase